MKKTISFVFGTLLILTLCFSSFARANENRIYANAATEEAGNPLEPAEMHCENVPIAQNVMLTSPLVTETEYETEKSTPNVTETQTDTTMQPTTTPSPTMPTTMRPTTTPSPTMPTTMQPTTTPSETNSGSFKDSQMLRNWFKSLPIGLRIMLAMFIYPSIFILTMFGR